MKFTDDLLNVIKRITTLEYISVDFFISLKDKIEIMNYHPYMKFFRSLEKSYGETSEPDIIRVIPQSHVVSDLVLHSMGLKLYQPKSHEISFPEMYPFCRFEFE
jgi:hypothetical protein